MARRAKKLAALPSPHARFPHDVPVHLLSGHPGLVRVVLQLVARVLQRIRWIQELRAAV